MIVHMKMMKMQGKIDTYQQLLLYYIEHNCNTAQYYCSNCCS